MSKKDLEIIKDKSLQEVLSMLANLFNVEIDEPDENNYFYFKSPTLDSPKLDYIFIDGF